ncbi:hypothetical protein RIF29_04884 [Crotalaria pallida]|uniref:Uncharacterized protein n=1 Tax=Crotalaria pallida TaxID=3830 RepID=A0AAN9PAM0_CROPI
MADTQKDRNSEKNLATNGKENVSMPKRFTKGRNSPSNKNASPKQKQALSGPIPSFSKVQPIKEQIDHSNSQGPKEVVSTDDKIKQKEKEKIILHRMSTIQKSGITGLETSMLQVWNPSLETIEVARSLGRRTMDDARQSEPPDKNLNVATVSGMEIDLGSSSSSKIENQLSGSVGEASALKGKPISNIQ